MADDSAQGADEDNDADLLDRYLTACEWLCEPRIVGDRAVAPAAFREAHALAPPEIQRELEILIDVLERQLVEPDFGRAAMGGPTWRLGRWMEEIGFDPESYVRAQKTARRRTGPAGPSQKVLRLTRRATKELGVSFEDVEVVPHLTRSAVVMAATAFGDVTPTQVWQWFRAEVERSRLWPLWVGEIDDVVEAKAQVTLAASERIDPVRILKDRRAHRRIDPGDLDAPPTTATTTTDADPATELRSTAGGGDRLHLLPAEHGWIAFAHLGWEDGGTSRRSEHVALLRHFEQRYGAELARIDGATLELHLAAPVEPALVQQAALDRLSYGNTTFGRRELFDVEEVGAATATDRVWGFWWD